MENSKLPAFPTEIAFNSEGNLICKQTDINSFVEIGITKREYFAAKAMQGLCANSNYSIGENDVTTAELRAKNSIMLADALLKQLQLTQ